MSAQPPLQARIVDRGYQHYDGVRLGAAHAFWAMARAALARGAGWGRKIGGATILKIILFVIPFIPIAVALITRATTGLTTFTYDSYLQGVSLLFVLIPALIAPDLLCPDRRERVLALYFASPVTRLGYLAAQALAVILLLFVVTVGPLLVYFVGSALLSASAADYVRAHGDDLGHLLLSGTLLAVYYSVLALAASSFSDRRAYAAGGYIGVLLVTAAASAIIARGMRFGGHEAWALLDLQALPVRTARWIFGQAPERALLTDNPPYLPTVGGWTYLTVTLAVLAVCLAATLYQYLRLEA